MSTSNDEITLDMDALDAAAGKTEDKNEKIVIDPEVAAKAGEAAPLSQDDGIEKLRKQLETERAARLAAENRAREAAEGEAAARTAVQSTQIDQIKGAISQVSQANDVLEEQYADLMASGDFKAAAKIQRQMGDNSAKLAQLEAGKSALERAPKPTPRPAVDPVEAYVSSIGAEFPRSKEWVRAHPEFVLDKKKEKQMLAAHELALARGYEADSDEYFRSIERTLDLGAPKTVLPPHDNDPDPMVEVAAAKPAGGRNTGPAAAPVSRSGNGTGRKPGTITLTAEQREIARLNFPNSKDPDAEYAQNLVALKKEGKLS